MPAGHVDRVWRRRSEWIGERKISEEMTEIVRLGSRSVRDMQFRICHPLMHQNITGFHLDDEQDWVAELECGHNQHVRHRPPWINRPWVMTENGRASMLSQTLQYKKCDIGAPRDRPIKKNNKHTQTKTQHNHKTNKNNNDTTTRAALI